MYYLSPLYNERQLLANGSYPVQPTIPGINTALKIKLDRINDILIARLNSANENQGWQLLAIAYNCLFLTIFMLIATHSIGFAKKNKSKKSIDDKMKNFYLNNHLLYVFTCIIIQTVYLSEAYYQVFVNSIPHFDPEKVYVPNSELQKLVDRLTLSYIAIMATLYMSLLQGLLLAYARTNEPVYSFILRKEMYSWFGLRYDEHIAEGSIRKNLAVRLMNA